MTMQQNVKLKQHKVMYFALPIKYNIDDYLQLGDMILKKEYTSPEIEVIELEENIMTGEYTTSIADPWETEGNL